MISWTCRTEATLWAAVGAGTTAPGSAARRAGWRRAVSWGFSRGRDRGEQVGPCGEIAFEEDRLEELFGPVRRDLDEPEGPAQRLGGGHLLERAEADAMVPDGARVRQEPRHEGAPQSLRAGGRRHVQPLHLADGGAERAKSHAARGG